jgi:magnesium chelatase family protein
VLFLDELAEFRRHVLDCLRQPLEEGYVRIARAAGQTEFPARFMLVAAMNPCPCGYYGSPKRSCVCSGSALIRYRRRISGPLLDRIDLQVDVAAVGLEALPDAGRGEPSAVVRERVAAARAIQRRRNVGVQPSLDGTLPLAGEPVASGVDSRIGAGALNAQLRGAGLRAYCGLNDEGRKLLVSASQRLGLSARAHDRLLRVARTIADLESSSDIRAVHLAEAIQYRALDRQPV